MSLTFAAEAQWVGPPQGHASRAGTRTCSRTGSCPRTRVPAATSTRACSAIPTLMNRSGKCVGEHAAEVRVRNIGAIGPRCRVRSAQLDQGLPEDRPHRERVLPCLHGPPRAPERLLVSFRVGDPPCQRWSYSMKLTPLPFVVRAMMTLAGHGLVRAIQGVEDLAHVMPVDLLDMPPKRPPLVWPAARSASHRRSLRSAGCRLTSTIAVRLPRRYLAAVIDTFPDDAGIELAVAEEDVDAVRGRRGRTAR